MITVEIDKKDLWELENNIKALIALTKKPVEEILRDQGRLFARDAANYTERYTGPGTSAPQIKREHVHDAVNTVRRVYKPAKRAIGLIAKEMGEKAGVRFSNYIRRRDVAKAQEMVRIANISKYYSGRDVKVIMWDGGNAHTRWKKGRAPVRLVMEHPQINKFIARKKKAIGSAKAGWARAAEMLKGSGDPTRGIPAYAKKKYHKTRGFGSVRGTGSKAEVTVSHYGKYGFSKTSIKGVWRSRGNTIGKQIDKMLGIEHRAIEKGTRRVRKVTRTILKQIK